MKKVLIILGTVAAAGFFFILFMAFVVYEIHQGKGPVLYSCVGEWRRIDEYAHQKENTNYIAFADGQLEMYQRVSKQWSTNASTSEVSKCEKMQVEAYARMDKNIKDGLNPLSYLDTMTNPPPMTTETK